jgi:preprotein translocase subunit YajC
MDEIKIGDDVVTSLGFRGRVDKVLDDDVEIRIDEFEGGYTVVRCALDQVRLAQRSDTIAAVLIKR